MKLIELYDRITDDTPATLFVYDASGTQIDSQFYADAYCWVDTYMDCEVIQIFISNDSLAVTVRCL